jgi:hypothetical protein
MNHESLHVKAGSTRLAPQKGVSWLQDLRGIFVESSPISLSLSKIKNLKGPRWHRQNMAMRSRFVTLGN